MRSFFVLSEREKETTKTMQEDKERQPEQRRTKRIKTGQKEGKKDKREGK